MAGLDSKGFVRARQQDLVLSMNATARSVFGQDVNLSERSPLGMIIKIVSFAMGIVWQLAENVYYSAYKDTAQGYQLDGVGQYIGITRKAASYATGTATFIGVVGTAIPLYFLIQSADGVQFWTQTSGTIPAGGTIDLAIQAIELGITGNKASGTITSITSPLIGLISVTNATATTGGNDIETDAEFRQRYDNSIAKGGASTAEAIQAELLAVVNVKDAVVTENDTMATVDSIPPKAIRSMLYGGTDSDIANAIFDTKAAGIQAYGTTVVPVTDVNGIVHSIGFSRVAEVAVYVNVSLTKDVELFPLTGEVTIKTAIIAYIGGLDEDSTEYFGLGLGDDVIYTKIIGLCHSVAGVLDVTVTLSIDNITFTAANVVITSGQVAITDYNKVVII